LPDKTARSRDDIDNREKRRQREEEAERRRHRREEKLWALLGPPSVLG